MVHTQSQGRPQQTINRLVKSILTRFLRLLLFAQKQGRKQRYLRQGQQPAEEQRYGQNQKQVVHISARRVLRQKGRQKGHNRNNGGAQEGFGRLHRRLRENSFAAPALLLRQ